MPGGMDANSWVAHPELRWRGVCDSGASHPGESIGFTIVTNMAAVCSSIKTTKAAFCPTTSPAVLIYQAHSAPIGMAFYTGAQFPPEYQGDAFVARRGSRNRNPPTGYEVVRVRFQNGWPVAFEDFLTGFLIDNGAAQFARLSGVAVAPYGSLFVADDANGVIYRVSWAGQ